MSAHAHHTSATQLLQFTLSPKSIHFYLSVYPHTSSLFSTVLETRQESTMASPHRVVRVANPHYTPSGRGAYVKALNKYKFTPTKNGPFFVAEKVRRQGRLGWLKLMFGKGQKERILQKRIKATGKTSSVAADDQQNDSEYLCPVQIGTPAKTFTLDFDTVSCPLLGHRDNHPALNF